MTTYKMTTELNNNFNDKFEVALNEVTNSEDALNYAKKYLTDRGLQFNSTTIVTAHNRVDVDIVATLTVNAKTKKISVRNFN